MKRNKLSLTSFPILLCFLLFSLNSWAQEINLTGKVTDAANGEPLPGVSVIIKGTFTGTATNVDGDYSLKVNRGDVVEFSFVGYKTKSFNITGQNTLNVALEEDTQQLQEVVVIGYGQVRKNDATGSVISIGANDFNPGVMSSPQDLLIGKTPGVQITTGGGAPGEGATIRIRGGSSMKASNDPLIVVDGVPLDNSGISGMRNPLNSINPADIETFTVLKDASSTAIYGARASNGVILITTKKGKKDNLSGSIIPASLVSAGGKAKSTSSMPTNTAKPSGNNLPVTPVLSTTWGMQIQTGRMKSTGQPSAMTIQSIFPVINLIPPSGSPSVLQINRES